MTHDLQNICMSTITSYVKNNWCSELKDIFTQLDMNTFYEHKLVCDITLVKRKLFEWMKADWQNDYSTADAWLKKKFQVAGRTTFCHLFFINPYVIGTQKLPVASPKNMYNL